MRRKKAALLRIKKSPDRAWFGGASAALGADVDVVLRVVHAGGVLLEEGFQIVLLAPLEDQARDTHEIVDAKRALLSQQAVASFSRRSGSVPATSLAFSRP